MVKIPEGITLKAVINETNKSISVICIIRSPLKKRIGIHADKTSIDFETNRTLLSTSQFVIGRSA